MQNAAHVCCGTAGNNTTLIGRGGEGKGGGLTDKLARAER